MTCVFCRTFRSTPASTPRGQPSFIFELYNVLTRFGTTPLPVTRSFACFGMVLQHPDGKVTAEDWADVVDGGSFVKALRVANPGKVNGPWKVLCDNESFLRAPPSRAAHRRCKVELIKIPAKSPDLNPVEKYWAWIRRQMKAKDLADLAAKRAVVGKVAYKARLLRVINTPAAKRVAANTMKNLVKTCRTVSKNGGAASGS